MSLDAPVDIAGVDGCKAGWIAVIKRVGGLLEVETFPAFSDLVDALPANAIIAVDMPIGLPARTGPGGRGPESVVRRFLGPRQSSVFSIPSRSAVYVSPYPFSTLKAWYADHRTTSAVARQTSEPPRGVSIQAFAIFPKIREIDCLLISRPGLRHRVIESHPEVGFWRLNGEAAMTSPKKIRGSVNDEGMAERRTLLAGLGLPAAFLEQRPPQGAGADDFLDACAMLLIAARKAAGDARPFPDPPGRDEHGIPIAIWA